MEKSTLSRRLASNKLKARKPLRPRPLHEEEFFCAHQSATIIIFTTMQQGCSMRTTAIAALLLAAACVQIAQVTAQYDTFAETEFLLRMLGSSDSTQLQQSHAVSPLVFDYGFRDKGKPQIVLIGDSITAFGFVDKGPDADRFRFGPNFHGWAVLLNETLGHQAALVNQGLGGSSTKGLNQSMPLMFEQLKSIAKDVALVNIAFGANDAVVPNSNWHQPLPKYIEVLTQAVQGLRDIGINNIVLMTPPPVGIRHPRGPDRMNNLTVHYARAVQKIGADLQVPVADIYDALMLPPNWMKTAMHTDQLHLSTLGNRIVHRVFVETIQRYFPDISAAGLPAWYRRQHSSSDHA